MKNITENNTNRGEREKKERGGREKRRREGTEEGSKKEGERGRERRGRREGRDGGGGRGWGIGVRCQPRNYGIMELWARGGPDHGDPEAVMGLSLARAGVMGCSRGLRPPHNII